MAQPSFSAELSTAGTRSSLLRRALLTDAIGSGASALLLLPAAGLLSPQLGLPESLLRGAGAAMVPWVALLMIVITRPRLSVPWTGSVIAINVLWVLASILLLISDLVSPTSLGTAVLIAQAVLVAGFAAFQSTGLTRER